MRVTQQIVITEANALNSQFKAGLISFEELKELLEDLKHTKSIEAAAGSLKVKSQLFELIDDIILAAKLI